VARGGLAGVLLVGGASTRFGSPKALARLGDETLAERAWRILGEACDERIAVGKIRDGLELPFPLVDDGTETRAPLVGLVAGLKAARHEVAVMLPVDCPLVTPEILRSLAEACAGDAAVPQTGPLPGAYRRTALPVLESCLAEGQLALRDALGGLDSTQVVVDERLLVNINSPHELPAREPTGA
jgi:molybdopterin-guanine dinucleotide biosynthesis protein A